MTLLEAHDLLAWVVVVGNGAAGAWALTAHWIEALRARALWWFTGAAQVLIFVQAGIGVGMVAGQDMETTDTHMFYGFLGIVAVGILYSYRQMRQMQPHRYLLYGFGSLFIMGLGIQAMITSLG